MTKSDADRLRAAVSGSGCLGKQTELVADELVRAGVQPGCTLSVERQDRCPAGDVDTGIAVQRSVEEEHGAVADGYVLDDELVVEVEVVEHFGLVERHRVRLHELTPYPGGEEVGVRVLDVSRAD